MKLIPLILIMSSFALMLIGHFAPCLAQAAPKHDPQSESLRKQAFQKEAKQDYAGAVSLYTKAYARDKTKFPQDASQDQNDIGYDDLMLGKDQKAIACFQTALALLTKAPSAEGQATTLNNLGAAYDHLKQQQKSIVFYKQALAYWLKARDLSGVARTLNNLSEAYLDLKQYNEALSWLLEMQKVIADAPDQDAEALMLKNIGVAYRNLDNSALALEDVQKAITLFHQTGNAEGEAGALTLEGEIHADRNEHETAVSEFEQALAIYRPRKMRPDQATVLNEEGVSQTALGQYPQAIASLAESLTLSRALRDPDGEATALNNLGEVSASLTDYPRARGYYQQALVLFQKCHDAEGASAAHNNLGTVSNNLEHYQDALDDFQQALRLMPADNLRKTEPILDNIGTSYLGLKQYDAAENHFQRALTLAQTVHDQEGVGAALNNLGLAADGQKQPDRAIGYYQTALAIAQENHNPEDVAITLGNLADAYAVQKVTPLAIFYGKQAVDIYQSIRQDIQSLDAQTQYGYLWHKGDTYRELANLLASEGRIPEAIQVVDMLKEQEFGNYVRGGPDGDGAATTVALSPVESEWQKRYQAIADQITAIGQHKQDLLTKQQQAATGQITLTDADKAALESDLQKTDADLTVANKAFQDFLTQLTTEFKDSPGLAQDKVQTVSDAAAFSDTLQQLGPGTVAIYTIVESDKVRLLVVTSQTQVAREYPISSDKLRDKVAAFRVVLQDPALDPRPLAQELYQILIGPIEKDLQGAQATTLMWSLDDVLRYIPMAALYDGKQYLVERYQNDVFTPASESRLTETPKAQWNGLGLGVSKEYPGFQALTGVPQELDGVIHDPSVAASQSGALPGSILLDTAFTQQAMVQALEEQKYPLVHIASHFDFEPGNETTSFLLLGDGSHLSLADIKSLPRIFQGVDLLTLSACDTANGSAGSNGHEVEGFAVLAQRQGARAVIASLWPVADTSTPLLMETFYRDRTAHPDQPKAEDLRQAQLSLLHGTVSASNSGTQRAEIVPDKKNTPPSTTLPFTPDPKAPFAHPYYWAPFILIGNWK